VRATVTARVRDEIEAGHIGDTGDPARPAAKDHHAHAARVPDVPGQVVGIVRQLISRTHASGFAESSASFAGQRVLLDLELEGVRCLLLAPRGASPGGCSLSPREQEIVRMVAQGYPNKTIAAVLDISSWTVASYLRRVFAKLGVRSRAAMVARVDQEGLVERSATVADDMGARWPPP
jgi:DNA-binding CsgD family transcriptional regulator